MTRKTVLFPIVICLIVGGGCALPSKPPPNRTDTLPANTNSETRITEDEAEILRVQRAATAAEAEVRRLQANETRSDLGAGTSYTDPVALRRLRRQRAIDSFLQSDPGRTKQLEKLYKEYNKRASIPPPEDKLRNSLLAIPELSHSVSSAMEAARLIRGHQRRLDIPMEDAILIYLTQDCKWDAENARSILERIEY
jgi:hypothetical protein